MLDWHTVSRTNLIGYLYRYEVLQSREGKCAHCQLVGGRRHWRLPTDQTAKLCTEQLWVHHDVQQFATTSPRPSLSIDSTTDRKTYYQPYTSRQPTRYSPGLSPFLFLLTRILPIIPRQPLHRLAPFMVSLHELYAWFVHALCRHLVHPVTRTFFLFMA